MPRLSCCFCIFSPVDALVLAGKNNTDLLKKYIAVEDTINHDFKNNFKIKTIENMVN